MRQAATRGLLTVMATGSVLASTAGYAYADASAIGAAADSPGVGSGNTVQVPVTVPVNVCGNTVNVVGLLNPAMGNNCRNVTHHGAEGAPGAGAGNGSGSGSGTTGVGHLPGGGHLPGVGRLPGGGQTVPGGSTATGGSHNSPGVGSGNTAQVPVAVPVNACGDSVDIIAALNPVFGNHCANHTGGYLPPVSGKPGTPPEPCPPSAPPPPPVAPSKPAPPAVHHSPPPPAAVLAATKPVAHQAVLASTGASDDLDVLVPAAAALVLGGGVLYRRSRPGRR